MSYNDFLSSNENPSIQMDQHIQSLIQNEHKKDKKNLTIKAFIIHLFAGVVTLIVCPQFGFNPFGANPHTPHFFMNYGMWACGLFCGSLFFGAGSIVSGIVLNQSEYYLYKKSFIKNSLMLSSLFVGFFMIISKDELYLSISFILFWVVGAVLIDYFSLMGRSFIYKRQV